MCGPNYELMSALDEIETELDEKLLSFIKEWKKYVQMLPVFSKGEETLAKWQEEFCANIKNKLGDFEHLGKLDFLLK
ncbi:hypothetical protein ACFL3G_03950 [Planctomycetota bacterium]